MSARTNSIAPECAIRRLSLAAIPVFGHLLGFTNIPILRRSCIIAGLLITNKQRIVIVLDSFPAAILATTRFSTLAHSVVSFGGSDLVCSFSLCELLLFSSSIFSLSSFVKTSCSISQSRRFGGRSLSLIVSLLIPFLFVFYSVELVVCRNSLGAFFGKRARIRARQTNFRRSIRGVFVHDSCCCVHHMYASGGNYQE
jgi:hypothetical protein